MKARHGERERGDWWVGASRPDGRRSFGGKMRSKGWRLGMRMRGDLLCGRQSSGCSVT